MPDAGSLYDVLLVEQTATVDEIKLAFKRRALQVHPDKGAGQFQPPHYNGGSKEAFHSVYQALEILSDPEARRKYDVTMTGRPAQELSAQSFPVRKRSKKDGRQPKASNKTTKPAGKVPKQQKTGHVRREATRHETFQAKQSKLLTRICDLLKKLPRAERNDVIAKQFSQKQRLILEKWMVDAQRESQAEGEEVGPLVAETSHEMVVQGKTGHLKTLSHGTGCALAFPAVPRRMTSSRPSGCQARKQKTTKKESEAKPQSKAGRIKKNGPSYTAHIKFDTIEIITRSCDLQTSLDYLVVLTAVKQKFRDSEPTPGSSFEERLQMALSSSVSEHGKNLADLRLRFVVWISVQFWLGKTAHCLVTPTLHSLDKLAGVVRIFEPFRQHSNIHTGGRSIYWWRSPADLQATWGLFQQAVADAWGLTGADSTAPLQKLRASYAARSDFRNTQLQRWEREHMAMQDRSKHRPCRLRERYFRATRERWERQQMALEDAHSAGRDKHRPALEQLLIGWGRMLKAEARLLDKERRRVLRQREAQRKKNREEQRKKNREDGKQAQVSNRKRLRELREENLRRESLQEENLRRESRAKK
eukprot:Skav220741  [mRNA]  locus=scaffold2753:394877:396714:- [translate_table: standard]